MAKYDALANEVFDWAKNSGIEPCEWGLFYNRKLYNGDGTIGREDANPQDWCRYFSSDFIMGIWIEVPEEYVDWDELSEILGKYNLYYEHCTSGVYIDFVWDGEGDEPEYTVFEKPEKARRLYVGSDAPSIKIREIMYEWYQKSLNRGDMGPCVLGAGFKFRYAGKLYFMVPQSPWQGSLSWEPDINEVKTSLAEAGATEIEYDYGRMD